MSAWPDSMAQPDARDETARAPLAMDVAAGGEP